MNTNVITYHEPYAVCMAEGLLFYLEGLLIASKENPKGSKNEIGIYTSVYPIAERGIIFGKTMDDVQYIIKRSTEKRVKLNTLPIMSFLREGVDDLTTFWSELKRYGVEIELPKETKFNVELYTRRWNPKIFIQTADEKKFFVECTTAKTEVEGFDEIYSQLNSYRELFPVPIEIRVTIEDEEFKGYETYLNNKLSQYEQETQ